MHINMALKVWSKNCVEIHGDVDSISSDLYSFKKYTEHLQKKKKSDHILSRKQTTTHIVYLLVYKIISLKLASNI